MIVQAETPMAAGQSPARTLFQVFQDVVALTPDKPLVIAGNSRWTYRDVATKVDRLAASMKRLGIGAGDVISIQLPNWNEFVVIHLAATRLGAITNPLLPIYRGKELRYILSVARSKMVFIPREFRKFNYADLYRELVSDLPDLKHVCVVGGEVAGMLRFEDLVNDATVPSEEPHPAASGDDVTILMFTSGTESNPKGVLHSHNTMLSNNLTVAELLRLTDQEIVWAVSPIGHATGLEWGVRLTITLGATLVLQDIWEVGVALELIHRERCTFTTAATSFATMLLEAPNLDRYNLSSLRIFLCGGAAIPPDLGAALRNRTSCTLVPCWGMSECFVATMAAVEDPDEKRWGTDGRAIPGVEVAVFDEARKVRLAPGEIGEIATRGPHVSLGYFNDPERSAETFSPEGWLFSNDLGIIDNDGYLRVVGRKKDIINRGGLKVSAGEVEDLLSRHPAVSRVSIVGVPDKRLGERACACVVLAPEAKVSLPELTDFLRSTGIAAYKLPEFMAVMLELPMTSTGKVQKFKLREQLISGAVPMTSSS